MRSPFSDSWRRQRRPALLMGAVLFAVATAFLPGGLLDAGAGAGSAAVRAAVAGTLVVAGWVLVSIAFAKTRVHARATASRSIDHRAYRSVNINHDEGFQ